MLKLFRKQKTGKAHPHLDKAASFFAKNIIRVQACIAKWLSKYEQRMTIPQKKIALLIFCISMSILSGFIFYRAVTSYQNTPSWLQQPSIVIPETHPLSDSLSLQILNGEISADQDTVPLKTDSIHH